MRMCAKQVIRRTVELSQSRSFFFNRLYRRLMEDNFASKFGNDNDAIKLISEVFNQNKEVNVSYALVDDESALKFLIENRNVVENEIMESYKKQRIIELQNELKKLTH